MTTSMLRVPAALAMSALLLAACSGPAKPSVATSTPAGVSALTLPVSINAVMVSGIDHASDPLFGVGNALFGSGRLPSSDDDWREVEYHAYQMVILGKVIQLPGTGPRDAEWTANPQWKGFAEALSSVGMDMLKKAEAKDPQGFDELGNNLVDVCEACHKAFKPDIPTMKIFHKPTAPTAN
jgi:hypothetical protein